MKISQEDAILIKKLYLSKHYGAPRLLSEFPNSGWKLGSINSLLKIICKMGTIVWQPGCGRSHPARCSWRTLCSVRRTSQKGIDQLEILHETAILYSNVHRIIHCNLRLKYFEHRRAQLLSEANHISGLLLTNNLTI